MNKFPDGFLWGAATSGHQVEGNTNNDWVQWEKDNAERIAGEAGKKWEKWQQEKFPEMFTVENYISGNACDQYNRYEEDFDLAKAGGHNAHRLSLEWSRIEPKEGEFSAEGIEHYRKVLTALRERGLEPFVTLWHWTDPIWVGEMGAWGNKETVKYFHRYAERVFNEYKDLVTFWMPLNEPNTEVSLGYMFGNQPPGIKSKLAANTAFKNLMQVQKDIYQVAKAVSPDFQIGCSHFMFDIKSHNRLPWNVLATKIMDYFANYRFFKAFNDSCDFFGIQYYQSFHVNFRIGGKFFGLFENKEVSEKRSDLGWQIYPEGIYNVLKKAAKNGKPIYITENGLADATDTYRAEFIQEHLKYVQKAIADGVDIRGYFHWSLIDNFEFVEMRGFWPRFGLIEIDYKTLERKPRKSFYVYKEIIENNGIKGE
ncbi:MAG: glycoside hydrolase family 1 protein [Candidatus Moranbacteria bacterium]|nr:glycoside hydrolase family 1 protein [Candidatus Moranbacteria bacterium]